MAERKRVDLQREADLQHEVGDKRPPTRWSEGASQRLESFKQGAVDRWGREVSVDTPMEDFYVERQ
jgi:hypothetical protein